MTDQIGRLKDMKVDRMKMESNTASMISSSCIDFCNGNSTVQYSTVQYSAVHLATDKLIIKTIAENASR